MTSSEPKRGEIWRVQFDPTRGDEIQKTRPEPSTENCLTKVSAANPLQTRSVSLERFVDKVGAIEDGKLEAILLGLAVVVQFP